MPPWRLEPVVPLVPAPLADVPEPAVLPAAPAPAAAPEPSSCPMPAIVSCCKHPVTFTVCCDAVPLRWPPDVCGVVCRAGVCALIVIAAASVIAEIATVIDPLRIVLTPLLEV